MNQTDINNINSTFEQPLILPKAAANLKPAMPTMPGVPRFSRKSVSPAAKPTSNPVKKDFGIIDFSTHDVLHGVSNTRNTRYQLDKQLKGVFNRTTERSAITKELGNRISSGGTLTKYDAKKALWNLQKSGKLTQGQVNRTLTHLGI